MSSFDNAAVAKILSILDKDLTARHRVCTGASKTGGYWGFALYDPIWNATKGLQIPRLTYNTFLS